MSQYRSYDVISPVCCHQSWLTSWMVADIINPGWRHQTWLTSSILADVINPCWRHQFWPTSLIMSNPRLEDAGVWEHITWPMGHTTWHINHITWSTSTHVITSCHCDVISRRLPCAESADDFRVQNPEWVHQCHFPCPLFLVTAKNHHGKICEYSVTTYPTL